MKTIAISEYRGDQETEYCVFEVTKDGIADACEFLTVPLEEPLSRRVSSWQFNTESAVVEAEQAICDKDVKLLEAILTLNGVRRERQAAMNKKMLTAKSDVEHNSGDFGELLVEWSNSPGTTMDDQGDVHDGRGHWWRDDQKAEFLSWLESR